MGERPTWKLTLNLRNCRYKARVPSLCPFIRWPQEGPLGLGSHAFKWGLRGLLEYNQQHLYANCYARHGKITSFSTIALNQIPIALVFQTNAWCEVDEDDMLFNPDHGQLTTYAPPKLCEGEDPGGPIPSCIQDIEACSLQGEVVACHDCVHRQFWNPNHVS